MELRRVMAVGIGLALGPMGAAHALGAPTTTLVSVSLTGGGGNNESDPVAITPDGQFLLFNSFASDLVAGDTNRDLDVFVRNLRTGHTYRVSVGPNGQAKNGCEGTGISPDGRYVVFDSRASNLTHLRDTNRTTDVFVRDRRTGSTFWVSQRPGGGQFSVPSYGGVISDDGRFVAYTHDISDLFGHPIIRTYLRDREARTTHTIDAHANTQPASISGDGRYIVLFREGQKSGAVQGIDVRDHLASREVRVPSPDSDIDHAVITPDARYVAFDAFAPHRTDVFRWHHGASASTLVATGPRVDPGLGGISADGRFVAFETSNSTLVSGDTNGAIDVFRRDMTSGTIIGISLSASGGQLNGNSFVSQFAFGVQGNLVSGAGSSVGFSSQANYVVPGVVTANGDTYARRGLSTR